MLSKCANSSCSNSFLYLTKGKLYRMETEDAETGTAIPGAEFATKKSSRRLEYFWLCDECAPSLTLTFKKGVGIKTAPKPAAPIQVAVASAH